MADKAAGKAESVTPAQKHDATVSRFGRLSMDDITSARPEDVSFFDDEVFAMLSARIGGELDDQINTLADTGDAIKAMIRAQNDRIAKLSALVWLLDRQLNANKVPLHRILNVDPMHYFEDMENELSSDTVFKLNPIDKIIGANWHDINREEGRAWVWSGPDDVSTIVLPNLGGGRLKLRINLTIAEWLNLQTDLEVKLAGQKLILAPGAGRNAWTAHIDLPSTPEQEFVVLSFYIRRMSSSHVEGRGADRRKIGVCFHGLELQRRAN